MLRWELEMPDKMFLEKLSQSREQGEGNEG